MIRNNLSVLMAQKQKRVTELANETGISRNTITSTAKSDGRMIQLETINKLCQALRVTPTEFFEYAPFDFKYFFDLGDLNNPDDVKHGEPALYNCSLMINVYENEKRIDTIELSGSVESLDNAGQVFGTDLHPSNQTELTKLQPYLNQLSVAFIEDIKRVINEFVLSSLVTEFVQSETKNQPSLINDLTLDFKETTAHYIERTNNRSRN